MDVQVEFDDSAVRARIGLMPEKVRASLLKTVNTLAQKLRDHIVRDKLMGQVLNRVTGALGRSIQETVTSQGNTVQGVVYSSGDVVYARIHEYGATVRRRMTMAWGREVKVPREVTAVYPERSFMRSSLKDMRQEIADGMTAAVRQGLKE